MNCMKKLNRYVWNSHNLDVKYDTSQKYEVPTSIVAQLDALMNVYTTPILPLLRHQKTGQGKYTSNRADPLQEDLTTMSKLLLHMSMNRREIVNEKNEEMRKELTRQFQWLLILVRR